MEDRTPNWNKWKLIPNAEMWRLIALSLDIEPSKVKIEPNSWMVGSKVFEESQEFKDRIDVLQANAGRQGLLKLEAININSPLDCKIQIANFAKWAISVEWIIPQELVKISEIINQESISHFQEAINKKPSPKTNISLDNKDKALSTRTENNYLRLIMALANGIKDFNPQKPYEAAQLIIDATEIGLSLQTIADYISKAYELHCKEHD